MYNAAMYKRYLLAPLLLAHSFPSVNTQTTKHEAAAAYLRAVFSNMIIPAFVAKTAVTVDPVTAPYGAASLESIASAKLTGSLTPKIWSSSGYRLPKH